ncbi:MULTISPECIES: hypothetical protein [Haloferax]|uniref:Uncharacterized protein n=1 Tax=Haloferax marinum TaxID=2666143 RepID=A0A6A8G8A1_9EURY|nr:MULTISPECIES: hypothetical protein [Haloferax]KAB1197295.1 hypothetical protein Hfx1150_07125 [Haloferax sp. CBA1150]MRW96336.1 hypothetical protein [Haloferax marinum]
MFRVSYVLPGEDEPLGRFLTLTLVIYLVASGFEPAGLLLGSAFAALAVWSLVVSIKGLWVGYLEGRTR